MHDSLLEADAASRWALVVSQVFVDLSFLCEMSSPTSSHRLQCCHRRMPELLAAGLTTAAGCSMKPRILCLIHVVAAMGIGWHM